MMTATDELRKLLDERGVEHSDFSSAYRLSTRWQDSGRRVIEHQLRKDADIGDMGIVRNLTPEQAIAATLGNEESYTRDDVESAFVSGYSLGSLPVGSDPRWDQNEQTVDEHMAELGWVRAATERGVVE